LLAKSFYREMKSAGFGPNQIVGAAGEIIDQLSASLRKHGQRIERRR
jgi:L-methionine (R)-S-oxide reductase